MCKNQREHGLMVPKPATKIGTGIQFPLQTIYQNRDRITFAASWTDAMICEHLGSGKGERTFPRIGMIFWLENHTRARTFSVLWRISTACFTYLSPANKNLVTIVQSWSNIDLS